MSGIDNDKKGGQALTSRQMLTGFEAWQPISFATVFSFLVIDLATVVKETKPAHPRRLPYQSVTRTLTILADPLGPTEGSSVSANESSNTSKS